MSQPIDNGGTPRTDAFVLTRGLSGLLRQEKTLQPMLEATIDFARQLERELAASEARASKLEEALEFAMSRAFAGMIGVSDELLQEWADDTRLSPDMRQDAIDYMRCRALLQPSAQKEPTP